MSTLEIEVDGRTLRLSTLDRMLWPEASFTKGQMFDYYTRLAPALLPHIVERPLTLGRFPEGVDRYGWYQTQCRGAPDWLPTQSVGTQDYCLVNDLPSLLWVANVGGIELHPFLARADRVEQPTAVVFDLDPGPPADAVDCCRVALWLREELAARGLASFPKTSGSLGLHVYVPLNAPHRYDETKPFAREIAGVLAERHPGEVTATMTRSLRRGKVFVDWGQNDLSRSTIAPYSLRAMPWPTVSTPLAWEEVERALDERRAELLTFLAGEMVERLDRLGDLFAPVLELTQALG
jgi:bifunctional non-homologous end joining protein LigD